MQDLYHSTQSHTNPSLTYCRIVVFSFMALSLLILSIYSNSFDCSWHFDDEPNITNNPNLHLKELTWQNLKRALHSDLNNPTILYRPVACFTFALNHYFGGLNVFGYHLVNLLIHIISSIFLFLFIYHTLNLPSLRAKYAPQSYFIALLATTLWAINPVQTQALTYIVQRMASLAGMFYIMSMYFYLRARTADTNLRKTLLFIACFISFLMALGSKENAAILPLIVFLYEALFFQQITKEGFRRGLRLFLIVAGAILVLGFAYIYLKGGNIFSFLDGYENRPFTLAQRLLTEPRILIFYVSLLLYPVPNRLSITHSIHVSTSLFDPIWTFLSILLILGAIGYSVHLAKRQSLFSFCILFFFLNHLIESTIFPLELVFEHRNYIPSMFFFLPIAIGFAYLLKLYEKKRAMKSIISIFIVFLLIGLGNSSFIRNFAWKNEKTLWAEALEKSPNMFRPHHNLAKYYQDHGFPQKAIEEYEKALKSHVIVRKDEMAVTYYNLGKLYSDMNALNKAIYFYHSALKINPLFFHALGSLASAYDRKGSASQANYYLQKAIQLNPYDSLVNFNLGLYYLKKRVPEKGIYCFNLAASNETLSKDCLFYLGIAYKQKNENGRAATYFKKAINNHVKLVDSHLNLAEIYAKTSRPELALEETRKALDLMSKSQEIFHSSIARIFSNKKFEALQPSKTILLPLLSRSIKTKNQELRIMKEYLLGKAVDHTTDNERELEFSVHEK